MKFSASRVYWQAPSAENRHSPPSPHKNNDSDLLFTGVVSYGDSDVLGIMHHARYLEVAERGRTQCLMDNGLDIGLAQNVRFAIRHLKVRYGMPLLLHQPYTLITLPHRANSFGINFRHLFYGYAQARDTFNIATVIKDKAPAVALEVGMLTLNTDLKPSIPHKDVKKILATLAERGYNFLSDIHRLGNL